MAELSVLWNLLTPPPARTDWELLAHTLRLYALWPMIEEELAQQRVTDIMNLLRAQGLEPGTEEYSKEFGARVGPILQKYPRLERRGITAQVPYRSTISIEEFQQKYPQQFEDITRQVGRVVDSMASHLPEEYRNQVKSTALNVVLSGRIPVVVRPGGEVIVDQNALARILSDLGPRVYQVVQQTPVYVSILDWLKSPQGGNAPELADYLSSTPFGRAMVSVRGDYFRDATRAAEVIRGLLSGNAQGILQSVESMVDALKQYPSVELAEEAKKGVRALDGMVRLGVIPKEIISGITSTVDAIMRDTVTVRILDENWTVREVPMSIERGLQVRAQQRQQIEGEVARIASALAAKDAGLIPKDLAAQANIRHLNDVLRGAEALGVSVWPILANAAIQARGTALDFASRQLAMARVRQQMQIDRQQLQLQWSDPNRVLASFRLSKLTPIFDRISKGGLSALAPWELDVLQIMGGVSSEAVGRLDQRTYTALAAEFAKDISPTWSEFTANPNEKTLGSVLGLFIRVSALADPRTIGSGTARSTLSDFIEGLPQHVAVVLQARVPQQFRDALAAQIDEFAETYKAARMLTEEQYRSLRDLSRRLRTTTRPQQKTVPLLRWHIPLRPEALPPGGAR